METGTTKEVSDPSYQFWPYNLYMLTPEIIHDFVNVVDVYYIVMLSYLSKEIMGKDFSIQHVTVKNDAFNRFFVEDR